MIEVTLAADDARNFDPRRKELRNSYRKLKAASWIVPPTIALIVLACLLSASSSFRAKTIPSAAGDLSGFSALAPIDIHAHAFINDPAVTDLLKRLNLRILNICVVVQHGRGYDEAAPLNRTARQVLHSSGGRAAWCSTFDPQDFEKPGFADRSNKILNETFAEGAVAVKIWKAIGMDLKKSDGSYLMADDPVFNSIYADIAAHNRTLVAHLAEPTSCWQPPNPESPDYGYYNQHPEWFMFRHPERPSKETILAARDRLLANNPKLRVVGCHLGSMEVDVDEIARHFDRYPNFAVDTAARAQYLMMQPPEKVRAFLTKYQDRVIYGTDNGLEPGADPARTLPQWNERYLREWRYFSTSEWIEYKGHKYRGLELPQPILRKLYHDNAVNWVPGILGNQ
jgi:hypothetical protein